LKSAVMNVRINIPGLDDKVFAETAERACVALLENADKLTKEIELIVYNRL
jgi:formiminotetrahydrofolate cyclodeaminase